MKAGFSDFSAIARVLSSRGGAEVCLSIVQSVMIDVVNEHVIGNLKDLAVHFDDDSLFIFFEADCSNGVKGAFTPGNVPFVLV